MSKIPRDKAMTRLLLRLLRVLTVIGVVGIGSPGLAQAAPPLKVTLELDKAQYLLNDPSDPILVDLRWENVSGATLLTLQGFSQNPLDHNLRFIDPDGKVIRAPLGGGDAPDTDERLIGGDYVQVGALEEVVAGFELAEPVFDANGIYPLLKAGEYEVRAIVQTMTAAAIDHTLGGQIFAESASLDPLTVASEEVSFILVADADGDNYSFPVPDSRISPFSVPDCDDTNAAVNPGATEIVGNGIDDDCDPATPDVVAEEPGTIVVQAKKDPGKAPIVGMVVKAFDRSQGSCVGRFELSPNQNKSIWFSCPSDADGVTDGSGRVSLEVAPGKYFVIGEFDLDGSLQSGDETYPGRGIPKLDSGETLQKKLSVTVSG